MSNEPDQEKQAAPRATRGAEFRLPFDSVKLSDTDQADVDRAYDEFVSKYFNDAALPAEDQMARIVEATKTMSREQAWEFRRRTMELYLGKS